MGFTKPVRCYFGNVRPGLLGVSPDIIDPQLSDGQTLCSACELCQKDTMVVKHTLTSCAKPSDISLRRFNDSIPCALKEYLRENDTSSTAIKILKESGIYNHV